MMIFPTVLPKASSNAAVLKLTSNAGGEKLAAGQKHMIRMALEMGYYYDYPTHDGLESS